MRALIDGDILTYRSGFAAEHTHYILTDREQGVPVKEFESHKEFREWEKENPDWDKTCDLDSYLEVEPVANALANVKSTVSKILDVVDADEFNVFLSSGTNFRGELATIKGYKANRKDARKPQHYDAIHEYLQKYYGAIKLESIEADDALALCQTEETVICSIDKDLLQVPGKHYNWVNDERMLITPDVGRLKLYQQVLTGDSTDNIPGIKGVGPVKAKKIIVEPNNTDSEFLAAVCMDHWREYFEKGDDWFVYNDGLVSYELCENEGLTMTVEPKAVVNEVIMLLTVGGRQAYAALQKSSEQVPLPSEKEREEAWATRALSLVA